MVGRLDSAQKLCGISQPLCRSSGPLLQCLQALVVAFTFLFGLGGRTQYMYAIMLTIMSLNALVLCQVTKFSCLFCNEHGSPHYYAARVLSICLGCLAPVLVGALPACCMKPLTSPFGIVNATQN